MDLAEQAEREIAEESGMRYTDGQMLIQDGDTVYSHRDRFGHFEKLWQALVRDRCSLLKLRKAAEELGRTLHSAKTGHIFSHISNLCFENCPECAALRSALEGK